MYIETRSQTITEAIDKLYAIKTEDLVYQIYKDENGNLWNWCDYDKDEKLHKMTVVECDDGHYTDTCITWFFTQAELNAMTKISINA